jgi:hypothetical protein
VLAPLRERSSAAGNMVDSPRSHKPKTPQKAPGAVAVAKSSASAAAVVVAVAAAVPASAPARCAQRSSDIDDILAVNAPAFLLKHATVCVTISSLTPSCQDIGGILGSAPAPSSSASSLPPAAAATHRCSRPCVGPIDGPAEARACSKLRCTKCDFAVARFEGFEWKSDVDYLFFRNNHPEAAKLKTSLKLNHGRAAYCCQCSWTSAVSSSTAAVGRDVRWVCAQH